MKFEQSIDISATPSEVFSVFEKVSEWPTWDPETESSSIEGSFEAGTVGKIKPKGAPESKIELIEVTKDKSVTVGCKLPLCKMHFIHLLYPTESGTRVVYQVAFIGFLAPLFGRLIGRSIDKTLPNTLEGLKEHLEA